MRLADVCAFYAPKGGGVRTYVERKLAHAEAAGVDLAVIVPGEVDRVERRGTRTRLIHIASPSLIVDPRYRYFAAAGPVHAALDAFAPTFVEASSPWRTASIVANWQGDAARSLFMHADPLAAYPYRWFDGVLPRATIDRGFDWFWAHLRRVAPAFSLLVAGSGHLARRLSAGGLPRVATVPLGIEGGLFSPARFDADLRRRLLADCQLPEHATLLIGVGRYAPEKRWTSIIKAAALAGTRRPIGLLLVGQGRHRARLARAIGDNPHIRLFGPVASRDGMARLMASADGLIHGCEAETFGLSAAEAVASGLPLIVPDEGGAADLAAPDRSERFRAGDPGDAAAAILRLLARDRATLVRAAQRAAGEVRTFDSHFEDLFSRYESLTRGKALAA